MRRKSERTASKKTKGSPEKKDKPEKTKRPKTRRRKGSSSSDNESAEETIPVKPVVPENVTENNPPQTSTKEASPEEANDQVWQVKAAEGGDVGEIQKIKICLTRPPSTPERADRSPRSKRKHSRSTSGEPTEERKKSKHRSKRAVADSKEEADKTQDSQGDEQEGEKDQEEKVSEVSDKCQNQEVTSNDTPISTTTEETKASEETKSSDDANTTTEENTNQDTKNNECSEAQDKPSDADTTVASPKPETDNSQDTVPEQEDESDKRSICEEKSEILEIHADESRIESSDMGMNDSQTEDTKPESPEPSKRDDKNDVDQNEVSITGDKMESINSDNINSTEDKEITTNEQNVVESLEKETVSSVSIQTKTEQEDIKDKHVEEPIIKPTTSTQEGTVHNGQTTSHSNRKRRWGRPSRITTQRSITISTDILKDIIPDVKPVEFDEVIEEKKHHRRVEVTEKLERPVLPKIIIDNTESVEINKKENDERDKENVKIRESNLSLNRKISIVKDSDSIIARPPSPPRHKQSNILFITNLVRPFTLPQLKNLLQRTGRIVESGFWIDRIKSKCYVQYESEDQAVETRHALHGVTWPVSNPKTLHVDFSTPDDFNKAKANEDTDNAKTSTIPGTVEDWLREQDIKRERGELEKPWERKMVMREWDVGKNEKAKEKEKSSRDDRVQDKRRYRTPERSPEPAISTNWSRANAEGFNGIMTVLPQLVLRSFVGIAVKEEQRRQHMAEHERRLQELRRTHRRH